MFDYLNSLNAPLCLPVSTFLFADESDAVKEDAAGEPKLETDTAAVTPPQDTGAPADAEPKKSTEEEAKDLKTSNPRLYNVVFGRGVKKGESDKKLPLTDDELTAATQLFSQFKPADIPSLLQAKKDAASATVAKAKAEKDFTKFAETLEAKHKADMEALQAAYDKKVALMEKTIIDNEKLIAKMKLSLSDIKINKELLTAARAKGIIDPTDAVVHLSSKLKLNDNFEIVEKDSVDDTPANIEKLIDTLIKEKPHLVASAQRAGQGSSKQSAATPPAKPAEKIKFKRSQLRDPVFYRANEKEILEAARRGEIEDDVSKT